MLSDWRGTQTGGIMNWKRRMSRNLLFALLGGVVVTSIYSGLLYTTALHSFAVKMLGPAYDLVYFHLEPIYQVGSHRYLEDLAVNVVLYAFWIFVVLIVIDLLRQLKRKLAR
jgi:hypothetical protein